MCLILFAPLAHGAHPHCKFVLAANRDEFYARPAHAAHSWHYHPNVFAGMDLEAGGTWCGITKQGRFAALTNYRDPHNINPDAPSRGDLTSRFLTRPNLSPRQFADVLERTGKNYNGFNIIWGDLAAETTNGAPELWWYSNEHGTATQIQSGVHGISNALLDTPWHKVERGKAKLAELLQSPATSSNDAPAMTFDLAAMMHDDTRADDAHLPNTGVGMEWERALSSMFVAERERGYGTRCTTAIVMDNDNKLYFLEHRFTPAFVGAELEAEPMPVQDMTMFSIAPQV